MPYLFASHYLKEKTLGNGHMLEILSRADLKKFKKGGEKQFPILWDFTKGNVAKAQKLSLQY